MAGDQTITLTSQQGTVPVTIVSTAPYPVTGTLTLTSDKLLSPTARPSRSTVVRPPATPTSSTSTCRPGRPGLFKVDITLHSPAGGLTLSSGQVTVRSTATSVVGVVLSLGALAVLVVWWLRTSTEAAGRAPGATRPRIGGTEPARVTDVTERRGRRPPGGAGRRAAAPGRGHRWAWPSGTTLSRITGVGRVIALTAALGGGGFADAYNLANTTPNIIYDIVLGGVLSATFVPVFVDHLTTRKGKEAWEAISAVVTVTITVLVGGHRRLLRPHARASSTSTR